MEFVNSRPTVFGAIPLGICAPRMNDFHVKLTIRRERPIRQLHFGDDGNGGFRLFHRRGEQAEAGKDGGGRGRLLLRLGGEGFENEGNDAFGFLREAQEPRCLSGLGRKSELV